MTTVVVMHKTAVYSVFFYACLCVCLCHPILDFRRRSGENFLTSPLRISFMRSVRWTCSSFCNLISPGCLSQIAPARYPSPFPL